MSKAQRRVTVRSLLASPQIVDQVSNGSGVLDITSPYPSQRIGEILVSLGALAPTELRSALGQQANRTAPPLGTILLSEGLIDESTLAAGLALQRGIRRVPVTGAALDLDLVDRLGADRCLSLGLVPWRCAGGRTVVATARPNHFAGAKAELEAALGPVGMAIADEAAIVRAVTDTRASWLTARAEARPARHLSVRGWGSRDIAWSLVALLALVAAGTTLAPNAVLTGILAIAATMLAAMSALKAAALFLRLTRAPVPPLDRPVHQPAALPMISMLVPLLSEAEITASLIGHLSALEYPAERLEILLVTEAGDRRTSAALSRERLPGHFRRITVPEGRVRTKPRALNYALDFARGDIVGVWDAEDAPDANQLHVIAARFATAPPEVVCLQGRLDFYNASQNWLSRCFALDYAGWFRIVLPGLARMGLAIPLGGTTLFFRRAALEALGRWDAHNVTEDADLGIRLARAGHRAEIVATTTYEEANCRPMAWVRQRTRWLKGYALTWAVHMRDPLALWRSLGSWRFLGFQVMFLGTVMLFLAAPLLWSLWALPLGLTHPLDSVLPRPLLLGLTGLFIASELVNIAVAAVAVSERSDRWLIKWAPTLMVYFPLGTLAGYRALVDIAVSPFYWDKTRHGLSRGWIARPIRLPRSE